jgi:shikimate kinase
MNIILTGFMGTGKTSTGKILSQKSSMPFFDTDALIETKMKMTIASIFANLGEPAFRRIEMQTIEKISQKDNIIISCGGGAVLEQKNIDSLMRNGKIINLYANAYTIYERVKGNSDRPVLQSSNPSIEKIKNLLETRKKVYANCDFSIDTSAISPLETAEKILSLIK